MISAKEIFDYAEKCGAESAENLMVLMGPDLYDDSDGTVYDDILRCLRQMQDPWYEEDEPEYLTDEPGFSRDYGPSNPWDAPGMRVSDFI